MKLAHLTLVDLDRIKMYLEFHKKYVLSLSKREHESVTDLDLLIEKINLEIQK